MFHRGRVSLLNVPLRPRVPGYCVVGSPWWLGSLGLNLPGHITLGQTWARSCLCGSQRPYHTVQKKLYRGEAQTVRAVAMLFPQSSAGHWEPYLLELSSPAYWPLDI